MKKAIHLLIAIFLFTGCSSVNQYSSEIISPSIDSDEIESDNMQVTYVAEIDLDYLINTSSNIIVAEFVGSTSFSEGTNKDVFNVVENIKGSIEQETINYYSFNQEFVSGEKYILFVEFFDSVFYEDRVYHGVSEFYALLNINNDIEQFLIFDDDLSTKYKTLDSLKNYISKVDDGLRTDKPNVESTIINTESIDVLVEESDYICEIKPTEIITSNEVLKILLCKIQKNYKGKLKDEVIIHLPSDAELEKEYLVFLTEIEDGSYTVNSLISFISKDDEKEYSKALKSIE
jgi:hypothetical protein